MKENFYLYVDMCNLLRACNGLVSIDVYCPGTIYEGEY